MKKIFSIILLVLGVAGLYLEQHSASLGPAQWLLPLIDYLLMSYLLLEALAAFIATPNKRYFLKENRGALIFLIFYLILFMSNRFFGSLYPGTSFRGYYFLLIIRNVLLILKIYGRIKKLTGYLNSVFSKPAQTVVLSFMVVILVGTLLLMMPFMTVKGTLNPLDAFFTVTSAVCVTGLAVVDTAATFTIMGKLTLLVLIQIGGLGIMLLSYFMVFAFRRTVSLKDRKLLSFMLNESDMSGIISSVKRIIFLTFSIELAGAALMVPLFLKQGLSLPLSLFYGVFHGVSAFCNAGFALFSNSLMDFSASVPMNLIICGLIIAGGISFTVLTEISRAFFGLFKGKKVPLSINSRVVLTGTAILLVIPMFFIYGLEHPLQLGKLAWGEQYLSAFFQSVTLRTAGFNTLSMELLGPGTLVLMIGVMFIGGAAGSTAGGIKVNTLGVVWAYIQSFRKGHDEVLLYRHQVTKNQILQAFTVIFFGILSIFFVTFILLLTEKASPLQILFETVSAFATVGLSTGITPGLSALGKGLIIVLMFIGRIGPLTLLTAFSRQEKSSTISYPEATLLIG